MDSLTLTRLTSCQLPVSRVATCLILPFVIVQLFNPAAALTQSSVFSASDSQTQFQSFNGQDSTIPNSLTRAQLETESLLAQPVSNFAIRCNQLVEASEVINSIDVTVFMDTNLEGMFDGETEIAMRSGVSMAHSLSKALRSADAEYLIESDGSILLISIDDVNESEYLSTLTYDVTYIASTESRADRLAQVLFNTIYSDTWEMNGGGNGTISVYQINGRVLLTINQSQRVHRSIRRHFDVVSRLGAKRSVASRPLTLDIEPIANVDRGSSLSSSIELPAGRTTSTLRNRRGFAIPGSGSTGGLGGGGFKDGGMF